MRLLYGNGSDITKDKSILRHARCKLITQSLMLRLVDIAKEKGAKTERLKYMFVRWIISMQL